MQSRCCRIKVRSIDSQPSFVAAVQVSASVHVRPLYVCADVSASITVPHLSVTKLVPHRICLSSRNVVGFSALSGGHTLGWKHKHAITLIKIPARSPETYTAQHAQHSTTGGAIYFQDILVPRGMIVWVMGIIKRRHLLEGLKCCSSSSARRCMWGGVRRTVRPHPKESNSRA